FIHLVRRECCDLSVGRTIGRTDYSVTSSPLDRILQRVFGPPCPSEFDNREHQHEKNRRRYGKFHGRRSRIAAAERSYSTEKHRHLRQSVQSIPRRRRKRRHCASPVEILPDRQRSIGDLGIGYQVVGG